MKTEEVKMVTKLEAQSVFVNPEKTCLIYFGLRGGSVSFEVKLRDGLDCVPLVVSGSKKKAVETVLKEGGRFVLNLDHPQGHFELNFQIVSAIVGDDFKVVDTALEPGVKLRWRHDFSHLPVGVLPLVLRKPVNAKFNITYPFTNGMFECTIRDAKTFDAVIKQIRKHYKNAYRYVHEMGTMGYFHGIEDLVFEGRIEMYENGILEYTIGS